MAKLMKTAIGLGAGALLLAGCATGPYYGYDYGPNAGPYDAYPGYGYDYPAYVAPPVVGLGFSYSDGGDGREWRGDRREWHGDRREWRGDRRGDRHHDHPNDYGR